MIITQEKKGTQMLSFIKTVNLDAAQLETTTPHKHFTYVWKWQITQFFIVAKKGDFTCTFLFFLVSELYKYY